MAVSNVSDCVRMLLVLVGVYAKDMTGGVTPLDGSTVYLSGLRISTGDNIGLFA